MSLVLSSLFGTPLPNLCTLIVLINMLYFYTYTTLQWWWNIQWDCTSWNVAINCWIVLISFTHTHTRTHWFQIIDQLTICNVSCWLHFWFMVCRLSYFGIFKRSIHHLYHQCSGFMLMHRTNLILSHHQFRSGELLRSLYKEKNDCALLVILYIHLTFQFYSSIVILKDWMSILSIFSQMK